MTDAQRASERVYNLIRDLRRQNEAYSAAEDFDPGNPDVDRFRKETLGGAHWKEETKVLKRIMSEIIAEEMESRP